MTEEIKAWHFVDNTLRDGRPIPADGEWLKHTGKIKPCESGLHASVRLIDALGYAPGNTICRVIVRGGIKHHDNDKIVGRERLILWRYDAEATLRLFARNAALSVAHLWDMPATVRQYLETGDKSIRDAARDAAWFAACAAAGDAAIEKFNAELESLVRKAAGHLHD